MEFEPAHPDVGASVRGVTLGGALEPAVGERLIDALARFGVLIFSGQQLSPRAQVGFIRGFCDLRDPHGIEATLPGHPHVAVLSNVVENGRAIGYQNRFGVEWHADGTGWRRDTRATSLYCLETPPSGGDTLFVSGRAAREALEVDVRERVDRARVVYSRPWLLNKLARAAGKLPMSDEETARFPDVERALAPRHPVTGERMLVFSLEEARVVDDLDEHESRCFLESLLEVATAPARVYRHRWRPGDLLLWDNQAVMHSPTDYSYENARRLLHRVIGLYPVTSAEPRLG